MSSKILAMALGALIALAVLASASPALALSLSQGPRNAGSQLSCSLAGSGCGHSTGASNGACSFTIGTSQQISLGNYGFSVPASAIIRGIRVEPDIARGTSSPQAQLIKGGSLVGSTKTISAAPSGLNCATAAFVSLGADDDMWGTTWSPAEVNASNFGVQIRNQPMYLDSVRITVFYDVPVAVCGDGLVTHDEQCDDGNPFRGDGCSFKCQIEQALDADAQKCVNAINKDVVAIGAAKGAQAVACLKAAQKGQEPNAQGCFHIPGKTLVKAIDKTVADADKFCATPPAFGFSSLDEATGAATGARVTLVADVFGPDLTSAVISAAADSDGAACQLAVAGGLQKLVDARTKPFLKCQKELLDDKTDPALSGADLEGCLGAVQSDEEDIAAATAAFAKTVASKCGGVEIEAAFPGRCSESGSGAEFAACVSDRAACRVCRFFNAVDGLSFPCDFIDSELDGDCD